MKKIYFVRHGESEGNAGNIRQVSQAPLTDMGRLQAERVAKRCAQFPIQAIISSTMERTRETTDAIAKELNKPVEYSDLFVERRHPSLMYGKPKDDPEAVAAEKNLEQHFAEPHFRFSDEENFDDLKARAKKVFDFLLTKSEEHILVVTHGFFLRILVAYAAYGESLTGADCEKFIRAFRSTNAGITILCHEGHKDYRWQTPWWISVWNDHAHLD